MSPSLCPFCGSLGKKTKEHRIPKSWKPYLHLVPVIVTTGVSAGEFWEASESNLTQLDIQYGGICSTCNNGWLREIDEAAKARILNLARRRTQEIPAIEILNVMRSVIRAGLMTTWGKRDIGGYPEVAFHEFHRTRIPPQGAHVFMGFSDCLSIHAAGHHALWPENANGGAHLVSWGLDQLLTVIIFPKDDDQVTAAKAAGALRKKSKGYLKQIWPTTRGRHIQLPSDRSSSLNREKVAEFTQVRALLFDEPPIHTSNENERLAARFQGVSEEALIREHIIFPSEQPPTLP